MADEQEDPPEDFHRELRPGELEAKLGRHDEWVTAGDDEAKMVTFVRYNLQGASLFQANLQKAVLSFADLRQAQLAGANLHKAYLDHAILRDADLRNANLTHAKDLQAQQLAGANVSGAMLDKNIEKGFDEGLAVVQEASKNARKLFLTMLLACSYSLLTIATTTDLGLILNAGTSELPIIRTQVPIAWFYLVASPFLLGVFVYFHINMQRLWEGLGKLPAIFPDGRELDEKTYPWLLIGLASAHVPLLRRIDRKYFLWLQNCFALTLAWGVVPFTLYMFWVRYIPKHAWRGTTLHLSLLILSALFTFFSYRHAIDTLEGIPRKRSWTDEQPRTFKVLGKALIGTIIDSPIFQHHRVRWALEYVWARLQMWRTLTASMATGLIGWFAFLSFVAILGDEPNLPIPAILYRPNADFRNQDISEKLEGWTLGDTTKVRSVDLMAKELRQARFSGAFLVKAQLNYANLQGADLQNANLQGAILFGAKLQGANLRNANLQGADLRIADLQGALLAEARGSPRGVLGANLYGIVGLDSVAEWLEQGAFCLESGASVTNEQALDAQQAVAPYMDAALNGDSTAIRQMKEFCGILVPGS